MTIPSYQQMMLPLLRVLARAENGLHHKIFCEQTCDEMGLSEEGRSAKLSSGQTYVYNRSGWAGWYMMQAGLVEKIGKAQLKITDEGKRLLATNPAVIDNRLLATYPSFQDRVLKSKAEGATAEVQAAAEPSELTPNEQIEQAQEKLNETLVSDLLDMMAKMNPYKFEQLVVDLLFAMGYGGSRAEAALVTQKSNDEGIDGIINEDRLGLDVIYVQAKRWQGTVGRVDVQNFVGALVGKHAHKGVFITTSAFHKNALEYAKTVQHKIILIGGQRLAELMIEYNVGVSTVRTIALKRVDSDYFEEE